MNYWSKKYIEMCKIKGIKYKPTMPQKEIPKPITGGNWDKLINKIN